MSRVSSNLAGSNQVVIHPAILRDTVQMNRLYSRRVWGSGASLVSARFRPLVRNAIAGRQCVTGTTFGIDDGCVFDIDVTVNPEGAVTRSDTAAPMKTAQQTPIATRFFP